MSRPGPIAPDLIPSPAPHADTKAEPIPKCVACGAVHGGVGEGRICLENEVRRLRRVIDRFARRASAWALLTLLLAMLAFALTLLHCGGEAFTVGNGTSEIAAPAMMVTPDASDDTLADGGSEESAPSFEAATNRADAPTDAKASLADGGSEESAASFDAGDVLEDAAQAEDVTRILQACTTPASCPACGPYPRSPCCTAGGFCGCEILQGQCIP